MNVMQSFRRQLSSPPIRRVLYDGTTQAFRNLHATTVAQFPRKRNFFSSNAALRQDAASKAETLKDGAPVQKRKTLRSPAGKTSLRRVAVEAQRSRETAQRTLEAAEYGDGSNSVTAICVADQFDMDAVSRILRAHGFPIDPDGTNFETDQVIHTRGVNNGDIFVFPSGSLVAWSLPEDVASDLATKTLLPAAINPQMDQIETEDFEYEEDASKAHSTIRGDIVTLGTKRELQSEDERR